MTKKQRKEHKMGNAIRRAAIMKLARTADPRDRNYWAIMDVVRTDEPRNRSYWANMNVGQRGKYGKD